MTSSIISLSGPSSLTAMMTLCIFFWFKLPHHNETIIFQLFYLFLIELSGLIRIFIASIWILIAMKLLVGIFFQLPFSSLLIFLLLIRSFYPVEFYILCVCWMTISPPILLLFKFICTLERSFFLWLPISRLLRIFIVFRMHDDLWFLPWVIFSWLIIVFINHISAVIPWGLFYLTFVVILLFFLLFLSSFHQFSSSFLLLECNLIIFLCFFIYFSLFMCL